MHAAPPRVRSVNWSPPMTIANNPENVRPKLQLLSADHMNKIHLYSINILEKTGIKVESKTALNIFKETLSRNFIQYLLAYPDYE